MDAMKRVYQHLVEDHFVTNRQMAFLSGPRQIGKTTLAEMLLPKAKYYNYDRTDDAVRLGRGADSIAADLGLDAPAMAKCGVIFDEIHKFSKWKRFLKGFFDVYGADLNIAVTGSARLNVYKRGGDSLMGRYFPYRIHPLSVGEVVDGPLGLEDEFRNPVKVNEETIRLLLRFGGFPEPFLRGNERFYNRWKNARKDLVFHEDLRDLSKVQDIRGVRALSELLAARVSGGINYSGLATDLQVAPDTVKAWIGLLESVYEVYSIRPWFTNVANSIRKQPKVYFWDWSSVAEGGMRNENFIASHLYKSVQWWVDSGLGDYELFYVRDKQQREVDFLIAKNGTPYMLVESKTSMDEPLSPALTHFQGVLKVPYAFQVAVEGEYSGINPFDYKGRSVRISAADLLSVLI